MVEFLDNILAVTLKRDCSCGGFGLTYTRIIKVPWTFYDLRFWGESVNRNSITMISKGYYYVIFLVRNFYIRIDPVYAGSWSKDLLSRVNSWESGFSLFSIDPQVHHPQWVLTGHNWNSIYKAFVFYFYHTCPFYP